MIQASESIIRFCIPPEAFINNDGELLYQDIYRYIKKAFSISPWYIDIPLYLMQTFFFVCVFLRYQKKFSQITPNQQENFVRAWCSFGRPFDGLIRLYRSLTLLKYYEQDFPGKNV
jgi:hypothetical protein